MFFFRRHFSSLIKAPWAFKVKNPSEYIRALDEESRQKLFDAALDDCYDKYLSITQALANHDRHNLTSYLENGLHKEVSERLDRLESEGNRFKLLRDENVKEVDIFNLNFYMGVEIDRSLNFEKEEYAAITTLGALKAAYPQEKLLKEAKAQGFDLEQEHMDDSLDFVWIYLHADAPANIVLSMDISFSENNPLTLIKDGKDLIYTEREEELHIFRFETCVSAVGYQLEALLDGDFDKLMLPLLQLEHRALSGPWTVVDIDNIMNGNPHVKEPLQIKQLR